MPLTYRDRGTSGTQLQVMSGEVLIATLWENNSVGAGGHEDGGGRSRYQRGRRGSTFMAKRTAR